MEIRLPACRCGKLGEDAKVPLILLLRIPLLASLIIFVPPMRKMSHKLTRQPVTQAFRLTLQTREKPGN